MKSSEIINIGQQHVMGTYARFPLALVKGKGSRVWDADGKEYIDFVAGIATTNLGHCHPAVTEAIKKQAETLLHVSNLYHIEPQVKLAEWLTEHSFAERAFFCNSGAEANEGAIKLARKYHSDKGRIGKYKIIAAGGSFHGRTLATLTATGQDKVKAGFSPLPEGFSHVPYDDLEALEEHIGEDTAAVILEPIQGEGGIRIPSPGYMAGVRDLCDKNGALLILDEIQTGMGRTGKLLAHQWEEMTPDIVTMAKGLGNGVPIGALLTTEEVASSFGPGSHATTFGGNPLCAAAALATVRTLEAEGVMEHCLAVSKYFLKRLEEVKKASPIVKDVRGKGLLIGVELEEGYLAIDAVKKLIEKGFLTVIAGERVHRLVPALNITEEEVDRLIPALEETYSSMHK
ncbi:MAG: acetylornithine transaminase [Deltaproteobacteria bacterium]|nr:MAG: acetylornithine transaminase [Deltaproteobacteria bacterium]